MGRLLGITTAQMLTLVVDAVNPESDRIAQAVDVLRRGGIVMFPTDTLYGLAVDPSRDDAVEKLYEAKGREPQMAVPLVAADLSQAERSGLFGATERRLAAAFWPGPLSLVVPARAHVSHRVVAGDRTIAIRVPAHNVARELARAFGACITATSANRSGEPPLTAVDATGLTTLPVDAILAAGSTAGGPPSTIVRIAQDGAPHLVRAGAIAWDRVLESLR